MYALSSLPRRIHQQAILDAKNGRRQLEFGGKGHGSSRKGLFSDDDDELDILPGVPASLSNPQGDNREEVQRRDWDVERQEYRTALEQLKHDLRRKEDETCELKSELDRKRQRLLEGEQWGQRLEHRLNELTQREQQLVAQMHDLERNCEATESQLEKAKSLLQARTEELNIAQAFMTTADQFSVADLVRLVEELNNDIFQAALNLSDLVLAQKTPGSVNPIPATEVEGARGAVANRYGEELTSRVIADLAQEDPDPVLFESLIQNIFATRCAGVIHSISPGNAGLDKALRGVWEKLSVSRMSLSLAHLCTYSFSLFYAAGQPAIAKNWLAMTSSQLKTEELESQSTFDILMFLLMVGGWRTESSSQTKLPEIVTEKLSQIQQKALKVREMSMEGIISADVEVFRAPTKRGFNPASMQDAYDSPDIPPNDIVICQTGLGLRYLKRASPSSSAAQTQRKTEIILKAKVLLASTLAPQPQETPMIN